MTVSERDKRTVPRAKRRAEPESFAERIVLAFGVDPAFAEVVFGDLAEEYAERACYGVSSARWWYVGQILRSAPYLILNVGRNAAGRARLAAVVAGIAMVALAIVVAIQARNGPPARLVAGIGDTVLVNFRKPVSLPMRVLDAEGRVLPDTGVRYTWIAGAPVTVSVRGMVTCEQPGNATVRASLGSLATDLLLLCRPLSDVRATYWTDFVLGDSARDVDVEAVGVDGRLVTLLGAWLSVEDTTVAVLNGLRVYPRSPGDTRAHMRVGGLATDFVIRVFEPVPAFEGLRSNQRLVATPVRLEQGASVRWQLPTGRFYLSFVPSPDAKEAPTLSVDGAVMCMPALKSGVFDTQCVARVPGAWVTVENASDVRAVAAAPAVIGTLRLHRDRKP